MIAFIYLVGFILTILVLGSIINSFRQGNIDEGIQILLGVLGLGYLILKGG